MREYEKRQELVRIKEENAKVLVEKKNKRKQYNYWMSLDPYEFEAEIAELFKLNGYIANVTKGSGDGGVDIKLEKDGELGIVQCKRYKNKVGPGPIRDLYGTMTHGKYKYAFIVCPSGFTKGAFDFCRGKNITVMGLKRILEMANVAFKGWGD